MTENIWKEAEETHKIWHKFCKYMSKWYYQEVPELDPITFEPLPGGKIYREFDITKIVGYDAMTRVEKYAKTHPEIRYVHVDDDVYAGSYLVLVPHPKHGITMIFIPQCVTINNTWFLYPSAIKGLQETIDEMNKEYDGFISDIEIEYNKQHNKS